MRNAAVLVASLLAWSSAGRCDDSHDRLVVAGGYQSLEDASGDSASVDFVRSSDKRVLSFGTETVSLQDSRWSVVRASVYRQLRGGADVLASASTGPGSTNGDSFTYERAQVGATVPLTASWRLVVRDTFVDVEPIHGHVVTFGANVRRGVATTQLDLSRAVGGNIEQHSIGIRVDGRIRKSALFAGALAGDSNNRLLLNETGTTVSDTRMHQAYAGVTRMLGKLDLTLTVDVVTIGTLHRQSIGAVVGIPLASR